MIKVTGVTDSKIEQIITLLIPKEDTPIEREIHTLEPYGLKGLEKMIRKFDDKSIWLETDKIVVIYKSWSEPDYQFLVEVIKGALKGCETCQIQ